MDSIDHALLGLIQRNGRQSYAQYGRQIGLSTTAVHDRLKKLSKDGILDHWSAVVSPVALGYPVLAFVRIQTDLPTRAQGLADAVAAIPQVLECHLTGGEWNCFLKIRASDQQALEAVVSEQISPLPGITRLQLEHVTTSTKDSHIIPTSPSDSAKLAG